MPWTLILCVVMLWQLLAALQDACMAVDWMGLDGWEVLRNLRRALVRLAVAFACLFALSQIPPPVKAGNPFYQRID